jgi:hypothetical protein
MRRYFSSSRRRREPPPDAEDTPPQATTLQVKLARVSRGPIRDQHPLEGELVQLRARLLRMIVANESARRTSKTLS